MKILTAYFSASGTTARAAKNLAEAVGADLYEIRPAKAYTAADLDWQNKRSRSSLEMQDPAARPALLDKTARIAEYDLILLGFPIWWYTAPMIVHTFLESYDFSGKKIALFATSGGSSFGQTAQTLQKLTSGRIIGEKLLNGHPARETLRNWLASLEQAV